MTLPGSFDSLYTPGWPEAHSADQSGLNSQRPNCLCMLNAGIKGTLLSFLFVLTGSHAVWAGMELIT